MQLAIGHAAALKPAVEDLLHSVQVPLALLAGDGDVVYKVSVQVCHLLKGVKQVRYAMLCCALLCYAMLCYAMLCYAMLCYVMLCYAMLRYATLCYATLCYAVLHCAMLCYATLSMLLSTNDALRAGMM